MLKEKLLEAVMSFKENQVLVFKTADAVREYEYDEWNSNNWKQALEFLLNTEILDCIVVQEDESYYVFKDMLISQSELGAYRRTPGYYTLGNALQDAFNNYQK